MPKKVPHYAVSFATRYSQPVGAWLTASAALARLDMLIDDAKGMKSNLEILQPKEKRWAPWFGAEIISYYAVGFVTCLEWHARSRLVDLLSYRPQCLTTDDVKQVREGVLVEMVSANVTVAGMVGASVNISTLAAYTAVFDRVFQALQMPVTAFDAFKAMRPPGSEPWLSGSDIEEMKRLFEDRNNLVHEINQSRIGHPNIRESWDPDTSVRVGALVDRAIRSLEHALSQHAPADYPNLLTETGEPVSTHERIAAEIGALEGRIARIVAEFAEDPEDPERSGRGRRDHDLWNNAVQASRSHREREEEFIDHAAVFHSRYEDMRDPLRTALARARCSYLQSILDVIASVWGLDELGDGDSSSPDGRSESA